MKLILGSRTYAPLSDVTEYCNGKTDLSTFGNSYVAIGAEKAGARRRPLETTRKALLEMAREPGAEVVLFVARDPETKQPTSGMAGIQALLDTEGIPFTVVSSPFPGSLCEMIYNLREAVDRTVKQIPGARKDAAMARALGFSQVVTEKRNDLYEKLEESKDYEVGNEALDDKYIRWLKQYTAICDALIDAERML